MATAVRACVVLVAALSLLPVSAARSQGPAQEAGVSASAEKAIEAELDKRQAEINKAVDEVVDGKDVRATLEALIQRFPKTYRDAVIARFRRRVEELNKEYERRRAEEEKRRQEGVVLDGELFNMVGAVLLMSTGSYESISDALRQKPEVTGQVKGLGSLLLDKGVTPDMKMVHRLKDIYNRAIQEQKAREANKKTPDEEPQEKPK